jgi:hypothetical protein
VTHEAEATCIAHGADVAVGRQRRHEVAAAAEQLSRVRDASVWALFKLRLRLTSGPGPNSYFPRFSNIQYLKLELGIFLMSKLFQIL